MMCFPVEQTKRFSPFGETILTIILTTFNAPLDRQLHSQPYGRTIRENEHPRSDSV